MSDFIYIKSLMPRDPDYPARAFEIDALQRVLDGELYSHIPTPFHEEKNAAGEYVPIRSRRPSCRHNLCRVVVDDAVALLFSDGHFPQVHAGNKKTLDALAAMIKESRINELMIDAATKGSVGSVAIRMRVLSNRLFFDALATTYLTPTWKADEPDQLHRVIEKYKVTGKQLVAAGYDGIEDNEVDYWLHTEWDASCELRYLPYKVADAKEKNFTPTIDDERTVQHKLGFVPIIWVKNLPGGDAIDGKPTFPTEAIDTQIEIDYQLSQAGRGLKYSSDPLLMVKEPAGPENSMAKGNGNALVVSQDGDAKLLEISGSAANAVIDYVKFLREAALEQMHGNRASAEKLSAAQSGRAMELLHQALIWLADRLRISYGEGALLQLLRMAIAASKKYKLRIQGREMGELSEEGVALIWPKWFAPTYTDMQALATALQIHASAGHLSRESAIKSIAADFDIEDVQAEIAKIEQDMKQDAPLKA